MQLSFSDIQRAWDCKDPALVTYMVTLAQQTDQTPEQPIPDDELTFDRFLAKIFSPEFRAQPYHTQFSYRVEQIRRLEQDTGNYPLPERLKLHLLLTSLWDDGSYYARYVLIDAIRQLPLVYGVWKALKHIYKAAERNNDYQILGEIAARIDSERYDKPQHGVSLATKNYMALRGWRYLRQLGESLPACYPEAAIYYLAAYPDSTTWQNTWIANHIFYHHHNNGYSRYSFGYISRPQALSKHRAFNDTWQRHPEPLLRLLTMARAEKVRQYACESLKQDFKAKLRDILPDAIIQLAAVPVMSTARDSFIVWLLNNSPKFEQHQFVAWGLHQLVVDLLESSAQEAQQYACEYAKAHARDLPLDRLLRLAENSFLAVRQLAIQLINEREPRQDIGLTAWGILLDSNYHHNLAADVLHKHFGRSELDASWFRERLLAGTKHSIEFCQKYLLELHSLNSLGISYFQDILTQLGIESRWQAVANFALSCLKSIDCTALSHDFLQRQLLHPLCQKTIIQWLNADDIKANTLPMAYYHALAYQPDWENNTLILALAGDIVWLRDLPFNHDLAEQIRTWLADVRRFSPASLGFDWLMTLACREEAVYHDFAVERMIKAFLPADFAPTATIDTEVDSSKSSAMVDLQQQSFLFTGKLSTMTRAEAEQKVADAQGKNVGAVTNKLDYLVIGDDGSPLYGNGRKGSKQVKAESLIAAGAAMKIISETAFLQMLVGGTREFSQDKVFEGCQVLWQMATEKTDTPTHRLALRYLRYHHPHICLALTDRPVDPNAEIPASFLSFERFKPLFHHPHAVLRQFAIEVAQWELVRWSPTSAELVDLCESRHADIREFMHKALLDAPESSNKYYRLDANQLDATTVYGLCESKQAYARQLGVELIQQHEAFQQPDALFPLTESPDREIRYSVMRILWTLYRHHATTRHWQPTIPLMATMGKSQQDKITTMEQQQGTGLPKRPEQLPATPLALQQLLQRWLYELPPARLGREKSGSGQRPLSASLAKQALIETMRDLALEDADFAVLVLPLLQTFTRSRGQMEQAACLVAVTRIHHAHRHLAGQML